MKIRAKILIPDLKDRNELLYSRKMIDKIADSTRDAMQRLVLMLYEEPVVNFPPPPLTSVIGMAKGCFVGMDGSLGADIQITQDERPGVELLKTMAVGIMPVIAVHDPKIVIMDMGGFIFWGKDAGTIEQYRKEVAGEGEFTMGDIYVKYLSLYPTPDLPQEYRNSHKILAEEPKLTKGE